MSTFLRFARRRLSNNASKSSVDSTIQQTQIPRKRSSRLFRWGAVLAALGGTVFVLDLAANDDFDAITNKFRQRIPPEERKNRPNLVILGTGWAGLSFLRKIHTDKYNVIIISPRNYFLFTPLLPGTITGSVEVRSIMEPIRKFCLRADADAQFIEAECIDIDPDTNTITCEDRSAVKGEVSRFTVPYDQLVVSVGASTATFGIKGVQENACFLRGIDDTTKIRNRIMDCFETAAIPGQPDNEINRLLHFVIVGGGPAGVESAAELHDFVTLDVRKAFPAFADRVKITLVEALPHILPMFDLKVIDFVENRFKQSETMQVLTKSSVSGVDEKNITVKLQDGTTAQIPYGALVWVAGNGLNTLTTTLINKLGAPKGQDSRRGLKIDQHLRVVGTNNIYSLGDCAFNGLPATAQVASQEGRWLGRFFNELSDQFYQQKLQKLALTDKPAQVVDTALEDAIAKHHGFQYNHFGMFAYVGDHTAVAEFREQNSKKIISQGYATFLLWRSVYLSKLLSLRNRVLVGFDWLKAFLFGRDISRG